MASPCLPVNLPTTCCLASLERRGRGARIKRDAATVRCLMRHLLVLVLPTQPAQPQRAAGDVSMTAQAIGSRRKNVLSKWSNFRKVHPLHCCLDLCQCTFPLRPLFCFGGSGRNQTSCCWLLVVLSLPNSDERTWKRAVSCTASYRSRMSWTSGCWKSWPLHRTNHGRPTQRRRTRY